MTDDGLLTEFQFNVLLELSKVIEQVVENNRLMREGGSFSWLEPLRADLQKQNENLVRIVDSLCGALSAPDVPEPEWEYQWVPVDRSGKRWAGRSKLVADSDFKWCCEGGPGHLSWQPDPDDYDWIVRIDCERRRPAGPWEAVE